jgi:hypothetical protein
MSILDRIYAAVTDAWAQIAATLTGQQGQITALQTAVDQANAKLDQIINILLEPAPIAGAAITLIEGANMAAKKLAVKAAVGDFQLLDNGTATGTISFVDAVGEPTSPQAGATVTTTLVSSDPDLTATIDSTGLVISIAVSLVTPLPTLPITDITVTATINITNPDGTTVGPLTAASQGIDLVAGGPAGASISLA